MKDVKRPSDQSLEITKELIETVIVRFKPEGDLNQLQIQMDPIIANAMFRRDKKILENERFETLIALSRNLDDNNLKIAISCLGYKLTVEEQK